MRGRRASTLHAALTVVWIVLIVPTLLWWRDSILWVLIMSLWANVVSHATAYEAARSKEMQRQEGDASS